MGIDQVVLLLLVSVRLVNESAILIEEHGALLYITLYQKY